MISYPLFEGTLNTGGWFPQDAMTYFGYDSDGAFSISQVTKDFSGEEKTTHLRIKVSDFRMLLAKFDAMNAGKWDPYRGPDGNINWEGIRSRDPNISMEVGPLIRNAVIEFPSMIEFPELPEVPEIIIPPRSLDNFSH